MAQIDVTKLSPVDIGTGSVLGVKDGGVALLNVSSLTPVFKQEGSTSVERSVPEKLKERYSVKDFGAKGDGTTDDYLSIQNAIDYISSIAPNNYPAQWVTLFVPPGTYRCNSPLVIKSGVMLSGDSSGRAGSATVVGYGQQIITTPAEEQKNLGVSGLRLLGGSTATRIGILWQFVSGSTISDLTINNTQDQGIWVKQGVANHYRYIFIVNALLDRTRTTDAGALQLNDFDPVIESSEITGMSGGITTATAGLNNIAVFLTGSSGFLSNVLGQFGDVAWKITGSNFRISNCRADASLGTAAIINGSNNIATGFGILNCGTDTSVGADFWDAIQINSTNARISGLDVQKSGGLRGKYVVNINGYSETKSRSAVSGITLNGASPGYLRIVNISTAGNGVGSASLDASGYITINTGSVLDLQYASQIRLLYSVAENVSSVVNAVPGQVYTVVLNNNAKLIYGAGTISTKSKTSLVGGASGDDWLTLSFLAITPTWIKEVSLSDAGGLPFLQSATGAVIRSVSSKLSESISLFDLVSSESERAAIRAGTSTVDYQPIIQALTDSLSALPRGGVIYGPEGTFTMGSTYTSKPGVSLVGKSMGFRLNFTDSTKDCFVIAGGAANQERPRMIKRVTLTGVGKDAFTCANIPQAVLGGLRLELENITSSVVCTNAFTFANVYASSVRNLQNSAQVTNAIFRFLATINGVSFDNLYCGSSSNHQYNYYIDGSGQPEGGTDLTYSHGVVLNNPNAQGGLYGFYVRSCNGWTINNAYVENVARPFASGIGFAGAVAVRGLTVNGGTWTGSFANNPYYAQRGPFWHITKTTSALFNCIETFNAAVAKKVTVTGGGGTSTEIFMLVNRNGSPAAYQIGYGGRGYTSTPTMTAPTPISGTADTLTPVVSNGRIVSITVTPGSSPIYAAGDSYPVAVLYGGTVSKVKFTAPYNSVDGTYGAPFHMLIGRDSTASPLSGISVDNDNSGDAGELWTRKAEGYGWLQGHSILKSDGTIYTLVDADPLIDLP